MDPGAFAVTLLVVPYSTVEARRAAARARYARSDKASHRARCLRTYHRLRAAAIATLGGECAECGSTEELEIHHVHGGGNEDRDTRGRDTILRAIRDGEPGFRLLCHDHHVACTS